MVRKNLQILLILFGLTLLSHFAGAADIDPSNAEMNQIRLENGVIFELAGPTTPEEIAAVESLDAESRKQFYQNRGLMLKPIAMLFGGMGALAQGKGQKIINAVNSQALARAPILAKADEFGVIFSANVQGGAALWNKGQYISDGFGLAIGFDSKSKSFVIELVHDFEKISRALPVVAQVGVGLKAMVYAANSDRRATDSGRYFTPPLPVATNDFSSSIAIGPSMAVAFPPFLDAFYTYISNVYRLSVLKVQIPATRDGRKVRMQVGFKELGQLMKGAFVSTLSELRERRNQPALICLNLSAR